MDRTDPPARIRALLASYRDTHYDVAMPDGHTTTLRVGRPACADILAWMESLPFAAFIGAANPHSRLLADTDNMLRHAALQSRLRSMPCRFLPGLGHVPGQAWRENALMVAGLDLRMLDALAGEFGQNATLMVPRTGLARLRIHRPEWHATARGEADLEWAA